MRRPRFDHPLTIAATLAAALLGLALLRDGGHTPTVIEVAALPPEGAFYTDDGQPVRPSGLPDAMLKGGYFGAYAEAPDGAHGYSYGFNGVAAADATALVRCAGFATDPGNCHIVFRLLPMGHPAPRGETLRPAAYARLIETAQAKGPRAFAASATGAFGWQMSRAGLATASRAALARCDAENERAVLPAGLPAYPCTILFAAD